MRAVVVYESMFGNTHLVADAVAKGLGESGEVEVMPVGQVSEAVIDAADLVVVGGPTHAHGMSRVNTRKGAPSYTEKPGSDLSLEPGFESPGLRDWLGSLAEHDTKAAAFDTRFKAPAALTGQASKGIARALRSHGFEIVGQPESFFVDKQSHLKSGEEARAQRWGAHLADVLGRN